MKKFKNIVFGHPIMTYLSLILLVIIISGICSLFGVESTYKTISVTSGEYEKNIVAVNNMFSISGLKYIFSNTVSNFVSFAPLSNLLIILIGIGVMEKSGFLKTGFNLLTKGCKKYTVTFVLVLLSMIASIAGDISYVVFLPLAALLFLYGKRNPKLGIIASFAGLACGTGLSIFLTSIDSSLLNNTIISARILDPSYSLSSFGFFAIMTIGILLMSFIITLITEKIIAEKLTKYESTEEDVVITRKNLRGLIIGGLAGLIYLLFFVYNILPGLPFSGKLLDDSQVLYIDKLFSYNSFFSNGFVFIVTMFFIILGLFYGLGAKTIKNNKDFCDCLGHSLDKIGAIIVLIFLSSVFISIFKQTNLGIVITSALTNVISKTSFSSIPLLILFFAFVVIISMFNTSSLMKWQIMSSSVVPVFMNAGISPAFVQVIFRFGESVSICSTPLFAYFVIYLALLRTYNSSDKKIGIFESVKYMMPYAIISFIALLLLLVIWYIIGLPLGIGTSVGI